MRCLRFLAQLAGCLAVAGTACPTEAPTALEFRDFYAQPVGRFGMEPSARLRSLDGHRVRLVGYMVESEQPMVGVFMLAPLPVELAEADDGPADDLPGSTVFVHLPGEFAGRIPKYRPGTWEVVGTLQLGAREEANGRYSYVRLLADPPGPQG
jgi:hypothetical protein